MRPKLRGIVEYVMTEEGMLFRAGDSFLPVKGQGVFELFTRLRPFLDGRWTLDQLLSAVKGGKRHVVETLLGALTEAEMLYDAAGDDPDVLPETVRRRYAASVRRIERRSTRPFLAFAEFRSVRALVLGRSKMALAVIKAGLELGLQRQTICAPDWNPAFEQQLEAILDDNGAGESEARVEIIKAPDRKALGDLMGRFDITVLACDAESDLAWVRSAQSSMAGKPGSLFSLLKLGGFVLAGPTPGPPMTGCVGCLVEYYRTEDNAPTPVPESRVEVGVGVGAGLLLHQLLDLRAGVVPAEEWGSFREVDLRTLQISRHILPVNSSCDHCAGSRKFSYTPSWPTQEEDAALEGEPLLELIYRRLVDHRTGAIVRVDEGDLLQLPHHQSGALWYRPGNRTRPVWTTEVGDDVLAARTSVARRVLEQYLEGALVRADSHHTLPVHTPGRDRMRDYLRSDFKTAIVASGMSREEVMSEALFRALARFAHDQAGWSAIGMGPALPESASITAGYLDDIGALAPISVESNLWLSSAGFEVLRFSFGGRPISVVAGLAGSDVWETGLKDVWLHVTALEAKLEPAALLPEVRFRSPGAAARSDLEAMKLLNERLGVLVAAAPLQCAEVAEIGPLVFACGVVSYAPAEARHQSRTRT